MKSLRLATLALALLPSIPLFAFNLFGKQAEAPNFGALSNQRDELAEKIAGYEKSIAELEHEKATMPEHDAIATRIRTAQADLKKAQKEATPNQEQIQGIQNYIDDLTAQEKRRQEIPPVLAEQQKQLAVDKRDLRKVEAQIEEQLAAALRNDNYTTTISVAFTILVSVVIIGFYFIALRRERIAEAIFAGEQGMQFVTLFLIVIAIILFGIMGTLEGKELSALLGGLSGYILGRTGRATDQKTPPQAESDSRRAV